MPGLQLTQSSILVAWVLLLYVPAGQGNWLEYDVPLGQKCPFGHGRDSYSELFPGQ